MVCRIARTTQEPCVSAAKRADGSCSRDAPDTERSVNDPGHELLAVLPTVGVRSRPAVEVLLLRFRFDALTDLHAGEWVFAATGDGWNWAT